jgi:hypothetical protein
MDLQREAEENLRTIRSLMERATVYRTISAPTALFGGVIGVGISLMPTAWFQLRTGWDFKIAWLAALVVTTAINIWLIRRDAIERGDVFVSPGMRLALRALIPPFLCGAVAGILLEPAVLPTCWTIFYGLGLLATAPFAPRSIVALGIAFLTAGLVFSVLLVLDQNLVPNPQYAMGATFGLFHLIYAACIWRLRPAASTSSGMT